MRDRNQKIDNRSPIETFFQCNSNNWWVDFFTHDALFPLYGYLQKSAGV
jgi:hypothetical protein